MLKKLLGLLSDAAIYGVSSALSQLINFFLLPVYTRFLTPEDVGIAQLLAIITIVFMPLANLGMTNAIFRRFNLEKEPAKRGQVLTTGLVSVAAASVLLMAVGLVGSSWLAAFVVQAARTTDLVRLTLVSAMLVTISNVPLVTLRAQRRVKTIAVVDVTKLLLSVAVAVWFVVVERWGVLGLVVANLAADSFFTVVQFAISYRAFWFEPSLAAWKQMLSYGLPFVPHHIQAVALEQYGVYAVAHMLSLAEGGLYSVALKFAVPVSFVVNAIQNSWVAYKFQIHADEFDPAIIFRTMFTYYVAGVMYLWLGVSVWGPELVRLLTPPRWWEAALVVPLAALIPVARGLYFMLGTGVEVSNNTRPMPAVSFAGLLTVIGGSTLLIPRFKQFGAPIATSLGWIVMAGVIYWLAQRRFKVLYDWPTVAGFLGAAVALVVLDGACQRLPTGPRLSVALCLSLLYPMLAAGVLLRSETERHRMQILWRKLGGASL